MKHRMKWLLALFVCICMFMSGTVYAQEQGTEAGSAGINAGESAKAGGVAIDAANFPDENFRGIAYRFDTDFDGTLSGGEINAVTEIFLSGNISDVTGIEHFTALESLHCSYNKQLRSLDVSKNVALKDLNCYGNQLTSLDVSKNAGLETLDCGDNQLTSLDVSKNARLETLDCGDNQLTSLDVSKNAGLETLDCGDNQLTSLDVSKNVALKDLNCYGNQLTSLDVGKNAGLGTLYCSGNQLASLDVSGDTQLDWLDCAGNQLASLDVSDNTRLRYLDCAGNQLTSLDVSGNTQLYWLFCADNRLTSLDVSKRVGLETLDCSGNQLTSLDVSKNVELCGLWCADNQLTSLDVSNNVMLEDTLKYGASGLNCSGNRLTSLDVSKNVDLGLLNCSNNKLRSLDVSKNVNLRCLDCSKNKLRNLDVSKNVNLERLECGNGQLTRLDVRNCTALEYLDIRPLAKETVQYTEEPEAFYYGDVKPDGEGTSEANASNLFGSGKSLRVAGLERVETSMMAADNLKKCQGIEKFENIIVACGSDYPDALTGSYLAKVKKAPMLLVQPTKASEDRVKTYVSSNLKDGGTVYILGGTGVVSKRFENSLGSLNTERLHGDNRYMTNLAILKEAGGSNEELIVCSGQNYADSLSASAAGKPIMLAAGSLSSAQAEYLGSLSPEDIYVIGGVGAVSSKIEKDCGKYAYVERVYGDDRYKTSVAVAKKFFNSRCGNAVLARAYDFPDGLSGGPLAMSIGAPLLLVENTAYQDAAEYAGAAGVSRAVVLGGPKLIPNKVVENILQ